MQIKLAYGKAGLNLNLPDQLDVKVIAPIFVPGLEDARAALAGALAKPIGTPPLREQVRPGMRIGVIFSDITRATPHELILPAVLSDLAAAGIAREDITLFDALGTHRRNSDSELKGMLGDELVRSYRLVQNDAFDATTQTCIGVSSRGHEIWLNRELMACDFKILTGFIEPHFFAGFSGGGKAIMPGMAGQKTVLGNHDAKMIGNPNATWGITRGNPIWDEITEVAKRAGPTFLVNVTMNRDKQITGVFAGDLEQAHEVGCAFAKRTAMAPTPEPFDCVITTNSGYPLDLNLYQSVKGMSAAAQIVRPGGDIIIAAECWDGIPDHGLYGQLLRDSADPQALLDMICAPGFLKQDQWQAQIQAQIQLKADVYVHSDYLTPEQIESALFKPCVSIEETVAELVRKYGEHPSVCVIPEGPQTIPYLAHN